MVAEDELVTRSGIVHLLRSGGLDVVAEASDLPNLLGLLHGRAGSITRMTHDPTTRAYVERRRAEGRTTKEIRRCLKRYLSRQLYRTLNTLHTAPDGDPQTT